MDDLPVSIRRNLATTRPPTPPPPPADAEADDDMGSDSSDARDSVQARGQPPEPVTPAAEAPRTPGSDAETLRLMYVNGVVQVLQDRAEAGLGPLPIGELEDAFLTRWRVPFSLHVVESTTTDVLAATTDALIVTFLQKWPNLFELFHDGTRYLLQLRFPHR